MYELEEETCRRLACGTSFGRVVFDDDDGPVAFPVNALFTQDRVLFRTAPDSALDRSAGRGQYVSYEMDEIDTVNESGWSVLVRGHAKPLADPATLASVADTDVRPWAPEGRDRWIEIAVERISGRIIRRHRLETDQPPDPYMPPD